MILLCKSGQDIHEIYGKNVQNPIGHTVQTLHDVL